MFERKTQKLLPRKEFLSRQLKYTVFSFLILVVSLAIGVAGYMETAGLHFVDAFLNASMILTGMGPVNIMETNLAKLFSAFYAIYGGVAFLSVIGIFLAPIIHRFMHKIHLED